MRRLESLDKIIGNISYRAERIEELIKYLFYDYYYNSSNNKHEPLMKLILYRNGLNVNSNIDCLFYILDEITDHDIRKEFELTIMHVMYFYKVKDKLCSELIYFDDNKIISGVNRYKCIGITPKYPDIVLGAAINALFRLLNEKKRRDEII